MGTPFSTDPIEDVPVGDSDYVDKNNNNFQRCRTEILALYNQILALSSPSFNPFLEAGQLEVNGNFMLHRRMHEVARTKFPLASGPVMNSADMATLHTGVGLGITGAGTYVYHPTICPGWYAPIDILPVSVGAAVNGWGAEPASGHGMQIDLPAAPRLNGGTDESVVFQPISVHNVADQWADRSVRAQITYEHDAVAGQEPEIYAAWDVAGVRTFAHGMFTNSSAILSTTGLGTTNTITFDFTPPAGATMLEVGVRMRDALAHTFIFRRFIVSTNLQRDIATAYPAPTPVEQTLIDSHYYRSVHGQNGVDFIPLAPFMFLGAPSSKSWACDDRRPVITPASVDARSAWPLAQMSVYARPLLVTQSAPHSGVLIAHLADLPVVSLNEKPIDQGGPGLADYADQVGTAALYGELSFAATPGGKDFNPDWLLEYDGEWMTAYRPLYLL